MAEIRCQICGAPLSGPVCTYCGTRNKDFKAQQKKEAYQEAPFTQKAGRSEDRDAAMDADYRACSRRNKWIAFLLCLCLGWLGVHRMYVGKWGSGILYMATRGLWGIGVVIDLILILTDDFTDDKGMKLSKECGESNGSTQR